MAVAQTITLPAQPADGAVQYVPLGGDGFRAPFAAYSVINMEVDHDASGGACSQTIQMDMRYVSLVSFIRSGVDQGTPADADFRHNIVGSSVPEQARNGAAVAISGTVAGQTVTDQWDPTPVLLPGAISDVSNLPRVSTKWLNVNGDTSKCNAVIYLFNIRVRELTPMGPLLWARGAT